jgi:hypothetical protein
MTCSLYRLFDNSGLLLYVGIAGNPGQRFHQHSREKSWWDRVETIKVEHYATRSEAVRAEKEAIIGEAPEFNVMHADKQEVEGGFLGSACDHPRYVEPYVRGRKVRRLCADGCKNRVTHKGMANGVALMDGCEFHVRMWVLPRSRAVPMRWAWITMSNNSRAPNRYVRR